MSKKTKFLVGAVGVIAVLIVGSALLVGTQLERFVGGTIEDYGSAATGTDVSVGGVDISAAGGHGQIKGLTIGNPPGYSTPYALRIGHVGLDLDLGTLPTKVPVVREVVVDSAHVNAEQRGDATNLTDIEHNVNSGSAATSPPGEEGKIIIDTFRLTHASITLTSDLFSHPQDIELDDVVVKDIGRSTGGATYAEATEAVLSPILAAAHAAVRNRLKEAAADAARNEVKKQTAEKLKDLLQKN